MNTEQTLPLVAIPWRSAFFNRDKCKGLLFIMTYAEKLKSPQWATFREEVFDHYGRQCETCGEDTSGPTQVHHRRYIWGREPWEYDMEDCRVLCATCHHEIHECENAARNLIRDTPAHTTGEIKQLIDELALIPSHKRSIVCAHAKNHARRFKHTLT
jgi:hypothetical protein